MRDLNYIGITPEAYFTFNTHQHHIWEIIYYISGTGVAVVGEQEIAFQPGTIICLPPHIPHGEHSQSGFRNIHLSVRHFSGLRAAVPYFQDTESRDFYQLLMQTHKVFHLSPKNWKRITDSLLDVQYQYMLSWEAEKKKNALVERFEHTLIANMSNKSFSLDQALKEIPLSEDHFRKLFKQETGRTPLVYLTEKRIEYAKKLMESKQARQMKMIEISGMVGFEDPYYFSRVFKKLAGKSPTEWISELSAAAVPVELDY